jgi:Flp pilus assembly protein TadG
MSGFNNIRNQKGSLSVLMPAAILIAVIAIGMFALDVSHNITVRSEMQNGADAAALAGAQDLIDPKTESQCPVDALQVASSNIADGTGMTNDDRSTVIANYTMDSSNNSGTCTVDANRTITNMFAKLIGHPTDDIGVKSAAIGYSSVTSVDPDQMFPLAVSLDTTVGGRQPLWKAKIGDTVTFDINSQQFKNAAFTSFSKPNPNASWLNEVIDQMLGLAPKNGSVPAMEIGDDLNMINGVAGQKKLADGQYLSRLKEIKELALPVMTGDPPYNQSRRMVGVITVQIQTIQTNQSGGQVETFTAKLVKGMVKGRGGKTNGTNNTAQNNGMDNISAGTVKLVI